MTHLQPIGDTMDTITNQEENEDEQYNPGHYYGARFERERFDAVVIDDDSEDWREIVKRSIAIKNNEPIETIKSYLKLGLL